MYKTSKIILVKGKCIKTLCIKQTFYLLLVTWLIYIYFSYHLFFFSSFDNNMGDKLLNAHTTF